MLNNTHQGFCIVAVTGSPGSGKSYIMTRDVIRRLLEGDTRIITNLPLNVDVIAERVSEKLGVPAESVSSRIVLLDAELLNKWQTIERVRDEADKPVMVAHGPWEFSDEELAKSDLILDECHLYCPKKATGALVFQTFWQKFLGEARHRGLRRLVFVTQDEAKVGAAILEHAELRYELTNSERLRDPWFGISVGDWLELFASMTGEFRPSVAVVEYRRIVGKLRIAHRERVPLDPAFFEFYRSHQVAGGGAAEGVVERPPREWEKRPRFFTRDGVKPVWRWFAGRNWFRLGSRFALVAGGVYFFFGGGMRLAIGELMDGFRTVAMGSADGEKSVAKPNPTSPPGQLAGGADVPANAESNELSESVANLQSGQGGQEWARRLPSAIASLTPQQREPIEAALREAARVAKERGDRVEALELEAEQPVDRPDGAEALPVVTAFFKSGEAMVQGRKVRTGDMLFFDEGMRRVKIRKIDPVERVVYLEDASILRFAVGQPGAAGLPKFAGVPIHGRSAPTPADVPRSVQPVGRPAEGKPGPGGGPEKSIVVGRSNADSGVRPPAGR